ncbi:GNAT family N-acetyltransferase [Streptomyces sp. NPDC046939]|uniref:GNAT family N-acetyltransferase n=1 Tax=Streptomyces sp. NPDC046939 TaxID=3155376 RepID=UPI0033D85F32
MRTHGRSSVRNICRAPSCVSRASRRSLGHPCEGHEGDDAPGAARPLEPAERWISDRLAGGRWPAWVAESDGEVCDHVFLQLVERVPDPFEDNTPIGYVTNFYVVPALRNRGAGGQLLAALREHTRANGVDVLIVWPSERSAPLYGRAALRARRVPAVERVAGGAVSTRRSRA